jgi:hypothetical protein
MLVTGMAAASGQPEVAAATLAAIAAASFWMLTPVLRERADWRAEPSPLRDLLADVGLRRAIVLTSLELGALVPLEVNMVGLLDRHGFTEAWGGAAFLALALLGILSQRWGRAIDERPDRVDRWTVRATVIASAAWLAAIVYGGHWWWAVIAVAVYCALDGGATLSMSRAQALAVKVGGDAAGNAYLILVRLGLARPIYTFIALAIGATEFKPGAGGDGISSRLLNPEGALWATTAVFAGAAVAISKWWRVPRPGGATAEAPSALPCPAS